MIKDILTYITCFTLLVAMWILIIEYVFDETEIGKAMRDKIIKKIKGDEK